MASARQEDELWRLVLVVAVWAAAFAVLSRYGVYVLPASVARALTLQAYLALVQMMSLGIGLGLAFTVLRQPEKAVPLRPATARGPAMAALLTPAAFSVITTAAFLIARPTLLAELVAGGRELAQSSSGRFGRDLVQTPAVLALAWGAAVAPISEEIFFRGALFTLIQRIVKSGTGATLLVTGLFAWLHWDMPGGLGIVRFVSALGLGLVCGVARQTTTSVAAPIVVHSLFNALSIASVRRWVVSDLFPTKYSAPTLVTAIGVVGLAVSATLLLRRRRAARG